MRSTNGHGTLVLSESDPIIVEPLNSVPMEMDIGKTEARDSNGFYPHAGKKVEQKSSPGPRVRSNSACRNHQEQSNSLLKSSTQFPGGKSKNQARTPVNVKLIGQRLSKEACDELLAYEVQTQLSYSSTVLYM